MKLVMLGIWRRIVRRLGLAGTASLALMLVAAALAAWLPRLVHERELDQADLAARTASLGARAATRLAYGGGDDRLSRYLEAFPQPTRIAADLGDIYASAERHQVALPKGEYQFKREAGSAFATYVVTLPIHAQYGLVKGFISSVLLALPHASLDELRLSREASDVEVLDAVVRFTLVYRSR